jgi:predicted porin
MNKKLIALAIAGAFAAPVAMADNSNVTIYGEFAGSVDYVDGGSYKAGVVAPIQGISNAAAERRARVSSNNSFLGFKGTEDLGNGWSAIWQFEQSIAIDKQNINNNAGDTNPALTSNQSRRTTFVGLSSQQIGSVTMGIHDTPFKTSTGPLDAFGQHTLADYRSIWGSIGASGTVANGNVASIRAENSVMYTSPNMGGFTIKALGAAQNEAGNDTGALGTAAGSVRNPHLYSVGGTYANGPIFATLAYEDNQIVTNSTTDLKYKNWRTGVGYSFAGFKVGLAFERIKADGQATGASQELRRNAWYLPVSYQMGNNTIKAAYAQAGKSNQKLAGADVSGNDGAKQWSLGFDHAMSKRTNVYALYTKVRNDTNGTYSLGGGGTGIAAVSPASIGEDPQGFSVGMIHKF